MPDGSLTIRSSEPAKTAWARLISARGLCKRGSLDEKSTSDRFSIETAAGDIFSGTITLCEPPHELTLIVENMFESELVLDIELAFVVGPTVFARESDAVPLDWRKIIVTNFEFEMDMIDPKGGENIIYKVSGARQEFFFQVYPDELIGGSPRWRITEWREEGRSSPETLGELKFEFR